MLALSPPSGNSSGASLEVPSEALLHLSTETQKDIVRAHKDQYVTRWKTFPSGKKFGYVALKYPEAVQRVADARKGNGGKRSYQNGNHRSNGGGYQNNGYRNGGYKKGGYRKGNTQQGGKDPF